MSDSRRPSRVRRVAAAVAAFAAVAAVAGCSASGSTSAPAASAAPSSSLPPLPTAPAPLAASTTSPPVRLQVPAIGVDTGLEDLGLLADGELASPSAWETAGWFTAGVRPGDAGPAIIAGHVDSVNGPAVFVDLPKLAVGDLVTVTRADGSVVRFRVEAADRYPKANFPTSAVYGPTPTPELRLITCTGVFDRTAHSYEDNLVVTAVLVP